MENPSFTGPAVLDLIDIFTCPGCKGKLHPEGEEAVCGKCGKRIPIADLPDQAEACAEKALAKAKKRVVILAIALAAVLIVVIAVGMNNNSVPFIEMPLFIVGSVFGVMLATRVKTRKWAEAVHRAAAAAQEELAHRD